MLTRQQISDVVDPLGWRLILGGGRAPTCGVPSLARGRRGRGGSPLPPPGPTATGHLTVDLRADRVVLRLQTAARGW